MSKNLWVTLLVLLHSTLAFSRFEPRPYQDILKEMLDQKALIDKHVALVIEIDKIGRPLTGFELNEINIATADRLRVREEAYEYFENSRDLLRTKNWKKKEISGPDLRQLIKSLSVAVTLFDMALYSHATFNQSKRLRRILNEADASYDRQGNQFNNASKGAFTILNRVHLKRAFQLYQERYLEDESIQKEEDLFVAHNMIQSSFYYNEMREKKNWEYVVEWLPVFRGRLSMILNKQADGFYTFANKIVYGGSKAFGNIVGSVQKRRGRLYKDEVFIEHVKANIQPLDIVLEKTPFRLTDRFIPGYWGHAAIYIGTVNDLKSLGIWDHPLVEKHKKKINDGKLIVEALRDNVQMNTIEHFSDIDDFAILRLRVRLTPQEQKEHILRALSHVGKRYDFAFDVETGKTIVCSELHYRTFIGINFNTSRILARSTISVDQVAEQAKSEAPLEPVMLYLQGIIVDPSEVQTAYDQIMNTPLPAAPEETLAFDESA